MRKTSRILIWIFIGLPGLLLALATLEYLLSPIYFFPETRPFFGDRLFNPYQDIYSGDWKKGNFQVQSRAWMGLTNGYLNSNEAIDSLYRYLGYDIIVTSDYQRINQFGSDKSNFIPTYEHGFNFGKVHQVLLGSRKVLWRDYLFGQSIHHKQHILNRLRKDNDLIVIAHPDLGKGYSGNDLAKLTGYDLIEVLNAIRPSIAEWDSALSAGKPAFILSNDDAHNIFSPREVGRCCTFVNASSGTGVEVIRSLKKGCAYGVRMPYREGEDFPEKASKAKEVPLLESYDVNMDTIELRFDKPMTQYSFIGQNGKVLDDKQSGHSARYIVQPGDTYIRVEARGHDGSTFYLNPVFRYNGIFPPQIAEAQVEPFMTMVYRTLRLMGLVLVLVIFFRLRKNRRKKSKYHA